jgi:hypothetical protein
MGFVGEAFPFISALEVAFLFRFLFPTSSAEMKGEADADGIRNRAHAGAVHAPVTLIQVGPLRTEVPWEWN